MLNIDDLDIDLEDKTIHNEIVKASKLVLVVGDRWHVISYQWYRKWLAYLASGYISDLNPDIIDNSHLLLDDGQLVRDIIENRDYLLLPSSTASKLYERYKVTDVISRNVVKVSETTSSHNLIELYPVKLEIYIVYNSDKQRPILGKDVPTINYPLVPLEKVETYFENLAKEDTLPEGNWRLWIKTTPKSDENNDIDDNDLIPDDVTKVTETITDKDGCWLLLRKKRMAKLKICDLATFTGDSNENCVELIYEYVKVPRSERAKYHHYTNSVFYSTKDRDFPRYTISNAWRNKLKVDHIVDAKLRSSAVDNTNNHHFFEARITEIFSNGDIKVHFLGFDDDNDRVCSDKDDEIMPLYSNSVNWRNLLRENTYIEARLTKLTSTGKWKVTTVDSIVEGKVKLSFIKDSIDGIDESDRIDFEFDDTKQQYFRIIDIESEEICYHGTHTKKRDPISININSSSQSKPISYSTYDWSDRNTKARPSSNGVVGLANLGNTCFMNSILQCLSNTTGLSQIFIDNRYKSQINRDNALGHGGKLVEVYADLIKDIWSNSYTKISPYNFKHTIGEFKPQFSGYQQQDSQEFMSFLLDGLHEDLNRIKKKPYVKTLESKGRSDDTIAREALRRHLLRNDSEIVDLCFGQLRSHVICTNCGHESTTYDPYSSLSLPIPTNRNKVANVYVYLLPYGSSPIKVAVEVNGGDVVNTLKKKVLQKLMQHGKISPNSEADSICEEENSMDVCDTKDEKFDNDLEHDNPNKKKRLFNSATLARCYSVFKECKTKYNNKNCNDDDRIGTLGLLDSDDDFLIKMFQMEIESSEWIDIYLAEESDLRSYYSKINGHGLIGRVPLTNQSTNRSMYETTAKMLERFVDKSKLTSDIVMDDMYSLYFQDYFSYSCTKGEIFFNNDKINFGNSGYLYRRDENEIVIVWKKQDSAYLVEKAINHYTEVNSSENQTINSKKLNIHACIEKYTEKEQMNEEELFFCSQCKQHKAPIKKLDLWSTPDVLILHLKRFEYIPGQYFVHRDKITDFVDYPIENLDLTEFVLGPKDAPPIYDLYAVSEHSGGLGGGHYTATCMNHTNNKWYSFNDSFVSECSSDKAITELAYVLFYKRKTGSFRWGGLKPLSEEDKLPDEE